MRDKKSLFSRHLRIITEDQSTWSEKDKKEYERLQKLDLPPLKLEKSPGFFSNPFSLQWNLQVGFAVACVALLVNTLILNKEDVLRAKGTVHVSVYWDRAGKVSPLTKEAALQDGDKVGASVIASEDSYAYWAITDEKMKVISEIADVEASRLSLTAGQSKNFDSSFALVSPNQGENLIVIVCPQKDSQTPHQAINSVFDKEFTSQLSAGQTVRSSNCVFIGYRLRSLQ